MSNSNQNLWNNAFSHIYVEEKLMNTPEVFAITQHFPNAVVIPIQHYKDVFNRSNQNFHIQSLQRKLILAHNSGQLIYQGAPVCQSFGQEYFYYTSNVMNCIYDCEYCYLQGMYPSSNMVVFLNLFDNFKELEILLQQHPVYVCISYDTDLLAIEPIFHFIREWIAFAKKHPNLTVEIRTKSAQMELMKELEPLRNIIYAWTLSPEEIQKQYEHKTPSLTMRMQAVTTAISYGHPVRLCFDPLLYVPSALTMYQTLIDFVFRTIDANSIYDVSLGLFRISKEYLKQMRKQRPNSSITMYPYQQNHGYCNYPESVYHELLLPIYQQLLTYLPKDKIFMDESALSKD